MFYVSSLKGDLIDSVEEDFEVERLQLCYQSTLLNVMYSLFELTFNIKYNFYKIILGGVLSWQKIQVHTQDSYGGRSRTLCLSKRVNVSSMTEIF